MRLRISSVRRFVAVTSALGVAVIASACATSPRPPHQDEATLTTTTTATVTATPEATPATEDRDQQLRSASATLLMVGVRDFDSAVAALDKGVGGIFLPSWANPELLTTPGRDIAELRRRFPHHPFDVAIDFEGGRVQRFSEVLGSWPSPRAMADGNSPERVRGIARDMGRSLRDHGITVDFAPVVDVDVRGLDVVGDRAFSDNTERAATYAAEFSRGLAEAGIRPVFKHFPGHGRASGDTHKELAVTPPLAEMMTLDLVPYARVLEELKDLSVPPSVMVGHLVVPGLGEPQTPGSLNPATYALVRSGNYPGGRPFGGVIYTDDLSGMKAISARASIPEAVTRSLRAGADQALWSSGGDLDQAIDAVVAAVRAGDIAEAEIFAKAARVEHQRDQG